MEDATKNVTMMVTDLKPVRDERLRELLTKPFPPEQIQQRSGGKRGMFSYVPAALVKQRLSEAFDFKWSWKVNDFRIENGQCIVSGSLIAKVDDTLIEKQGFGSKVITGEIGDDFKAASSDALKVAASLFGIGLHLYMETKPQAPQNMPPPQQHGYPQQGYQQQPRQQYQQQQRPSQQQYAPPQQYPQHPQQQFHQNPQQQFQQTPQQFQQYPQPQMNVPPQIPIQQQQMQPQMPPPVAPPMPPQQVPPPMPPPVQAPAVTNQMANTEPSVSDIDDAKGIG